MRFFIFRKGDFMHILVRRLFSRAPLAAVLAGALALPVAVHAQIGGVGGMAHGGLDSGRNMNQIKDPSQLAADAYSRGMKAKRKAEKEKDPQDKKKLYEKAQDELEKSVKLQENYDALLALGQVDLALGDTASAGTFCSQAQSLKPGDAAAKDCMDNAAKTSAPALVKSSGMPAAAGQAATASQPAAANQPAANQPAPPPPL
jgi:hypothetical protein